jgi:hypothetical protein
MKKVYNRVSKTHQGIPQTYRRAPPRSLGGDICRPQEGTFQNGLRSSYITWDDEGYDIESLPGLRGGVPEKPP